MNNLQKFESKSFGKILTKAGDVNSLSFKVIDKKALQKIENFMPEINRATSIFCKQNSQTTSSLMTLTMLDSGPYRTLRQILAQIESKRQALKEALYKNEKKKIKHKRFHRKLECDKLDDLDRIEIELKKAKIEADIIDSQVHIEAAIKEIGAYQDRYKEICKNHNISENWDEYDFEEAEIEHHIKCIFRNAIRDRMQGGHNQGTMEYMEQFGIEPILAYKLVDEFINNTKDTMNKTNTLPSIEIRYQFYDNMYKMFKEEYRKALERIGIDNITYADWLMKKNI